MSKEGYSTGTDNCLAWGELQIALLQYAEESPNILDMDGGGAIKTNRIAQVLADRVQTGNYTLHQPYERAWSASVTVWHLKPLV